MDQKQQVQPNHAREYLALQKAHQELERRVEERTAELVTANEQLRREVADRRRAEEGLRQSEEKYRMLVETSPDAVIMADLGGKITFASRRTAELYGCETAAELIGRNPLDIVAPEDHAAFLGDLHRTLQDGLSRVVEYTLLRKDGTRFAGEMSGALIRDGAGNPTALMALVRDVTKRKQAEQKLAHFSAIVSSSRDAISGGTLDGIITVWNAAAERLYGYTAEEAIGQRAEILLPPDRSDEIVLSLEKIKRGEGVDGVDTVRRRKDGTLVDASLTLSPIQDASGQIVGAAAVVRDITERKRAEAALLRAKREWERTFDSVPDLIAILDEHHRIVRVNQAMATRLGLTPKQCIGLTCYEGVHGLAEAPEFCPHTLTMADGKGHAVALHEDRLGGDFLVTTTPLFDERNQIVGSVHVARDVTEQKKIHEALEKEHRTLKHLLQSSDHERQLIAYEIHDGLAQQLAGALMQFETYCHQKETNPKQAAKAFDAAMTMLRQGHFETRHLISGVRPPILDESGIVAAVAHLVNEQRLHMGPKIEFRSDVEFHRLVPILENAIYRIVQEGLANACKHSESKRIRVELVQDGDHLHVEVHDWGIGFKPGEVEEARFGLDGIRQRARLLGGNAAVESTPGQGTCVTVDLPLVAQE